MFRENDCCIYTFCLSSAPQGENPIYKSAVTTVVNPKYEGKWWSFAVTTLYGTECGINGAGFLMLSLFVCCSHKTLAFCHYFSFTNRFCLLCILWKCTVCIDVGGLFYFFHPCGTWTNELTDKIEKKCFFCGLLKEPSSHLCCVGNSGQQSSDGRTQPSDGFRSPGPSVCVLSGVFSSHKMFLQMFVCSSWDSTIN